MKVNCHNFAESDSNSDNATHAFQVSSNILLSGINFENTLSIRRRRENNEQLLLEVALKNLMTNLLILKMNSSKVMLAIQPLGIDTKVSNLIGHWRNRNTK